MAADQNYKHTKRSYETVKKRFVPVMLASALMLALAGCGAKSGETTAASASAESTEAEAGTEAEETAAKEDGAAAAEVVSEPVTIRVGIPTAPPSLPILHMIEEKMLGENVTIDIDVWNAPEQLIAMVQDSEHDMFAFPLTVIGKLYNNGLDVRLMNVNTWGVTYFLTTDENFSTWADLKGKTVYVPLQSSPPDALTQYFLNEAGLKVGEDVEIIYASTAEVAALLASGEAEYATLIEPQVTAAMTQNDKVIRALSFQDEWQRVTGTDTMIPNAGFGTTQNFIDENPELVEAFQTAYEESLQWVLEHPEETGALAEKYLDMKPALVQKAIPTMGLAFKTAEDAKPELDTFYQLLNDFDATMIGGKQPDDGMYYHAK